MHEIRAEEGHDAAEDGVHGHVPGHPLYDEDIHADRRGDEPHLRHARDQDAEPDRVEMEPLDDRVKNGNGQQDDRERVRGQDQDQVNHHDQDQDDVRFRGRPDTNSESWNGTRVIARKYPRSMAPSIRIMKTMAVVAARVAQAGFQEPQRELPTFRIVMTKAPKAPMAAASVGVKTPK